MAVLASEIIVMVSSNGDRQCPLCHDFSLDGTKDWEESCNHLLREHGLKCLHVGQETAPSFDGSPYHNTVAVFGK